MAKTKTKQIGEAIKGLNANANTNSNLIEHDLASVNLNAYHQTNPTDYQIAPVDLPEESAVDTTLQDLVVANEPVVDTLLVDTPITVDSPITVSTDAYNGFFHLNGGVDANGYPADWTGSVVGVQQLSGEFIIGSASFTIQSMECRHLTPEYTEDAFTNQWLTDYGQWIFKVTTADGMKMVFTMNLASIGGHIVNVEYEVDSQGNPVGTLPNLGDPYLTDLTREAVEAYIYAQSNPVAPDPVVVDYHVVDPVVVSPVVTGLVLIGGDDNDVLIGTDKDDLLTGGAGNDTLTGGLGSDTFNVDAGTDTITDWGALVSPTLEYTDPSTGLVFTHFGIYSTIDVLNVAAGAIAIINGNDTHEIISVIGANNLGTIIINGAGGSDRLGGSAGADMLNGGADFDLLVGAGGNDTLTGGADNDYLYGGLGNDTFNVDAGADRILDWSGNDTLNVSVGATADISGHIGDYRSQPDIRMLVDGNEWPWFTTLEYIINHYTISVANANNAGTIILTGAEGNDQLIGSAGTDILIGNSGSDTLVGGAGDDTLNGGTGGYGWESPYGVMFTSPILYEYPFTPPPPPPPRGDLLTGGAGRDTFEFNLATDTYGTWASADTITDFVSGIDKLDFNTSAGTNSNFVEADGAGFADEAAALAAAQAAMDGTALYYLAYNVGGDGYLYYDADGIDGGEMVIKLIGVTDASHFNFTDIV